MIYVLIGMSLLFLAIGFLVTEQNAKYLLAGYNTMSQTERSKVNIKAYIPFFRRFHIFLGISFLILGMVVTYLISRKAGEIFLVAYPVLAYGYLIWKGNRAHRGSYY